MNIDYLKIEKVMTVDKEHREDAVKINKILQDNPDLSYEFVR
jgi:hypothetical protein